MSTTHNNGTGNVQLLLGELVLINVVHRRVVEVVTGKLAARLVRRATIVSDMVT